MFWILFLIALFHVKHFVADYPLQSPGMAHDKGLEGPNCLPALGVHALIHGFLTVFVILTVGLRFWWIAVIDVVLHGVIDRIKAVNSRRWGPEDKYFWWALGLDQLAHSFCYLGYVAILVHRW